MCVCERHLLWEATPLTQLSPSPVVGGHPARRLRRMPVASTMTVLGQGGVRVLVGLVVVVHGRGGRRRRAAVAVVWVWALVWVLVLVLVMVAPAGNGRGRGAVVDVERAQTRKQLGDHLVGHFGI